MILTVEDTSQNSGDDDDTIVITPKPPADQPLQDDHSLLAVRSKLFYKKNESYVELGNSITDSIKCQYNYRSWGIKSEGGTI